MKECLFPLQNLIFLTLLNTCLYVRRNKSSFVGRAVMSEYQKKASRIRSLNSLESNENGDYILYWMTSARRYHYNAALDRAVELSLVMNKPILVVECMSMRHKWANERILSFAVQGMLDNVKIFAKNKISYLPWVETHKDAGDSLLAKLSSHSCLVIIDDYPTYLPRLVMERAAVLCKVKLEAADSNGILPIAWAEKEHLTAYSFRKHVQRSMADALMNLPSRSVMENVAKDLLFDELEMVSLFAAIEVEFTPLEWLWRVGEAGKISEQAMASLDIDHEVKAVRNMKGGRFEAKKRMEIFLEINLRRYSTHRNNTEDPSVSKLSPWFHFGHISTIEVIVQLLERSNWTYDMTCFEDMGKGTRSGWWGLSESEESFLDQIITWRELGFNFAHYRKDHKSIDSIPNWAKKSLSEHADDDRKPYTFEEIENADTDNEVWNAAQRELLRSGVIHNYMRMVWGKKILEWAPNPNTAADWMIRINDRWALDGRDPNSYTGIFWVLGRHDRAWGPERPVFGKVRYMTTESARRKLKLKNYISRWAENAPLPKDIQRL